MYRGTMGMMNCAPERCNAPKTASGIAKHKLLNATILSGPRATAISFFAAHTPIKKSAMPAAHIDVAVRDNSTNMTSMVGRMDSRVGAECEILIQNGAFERDAAAYLDF